MRVKRPRSLRTQTPYAITRSRKAWDRYALAAPDDYWDEVARSDKYHLKPMGYIWSVLQLGLRDGVAALAAEYEVLEAPCA